MRFPRFVPLFVLVSVSTLPLSAQSPNGNINGLVSDPSSAAVAKAEVVAVNDVTGVQYTTKTNNEGIYVLSSLPPGPYRLQVSKVGFKTIIKPDIVLNIQDALSINFTLPVGAVFEILTVEGGAPLVNTESAAVSTVVDETYVRNMPLNGRSLQDLILLTPGVVTQTPQNTNSALGQTGEFSVNGQRPESNYYLVDGVSANVGATPGFAMTMGAGLSGAVPAATALGTTQSLVSVDDLQEFRVQSSTYSAEYGRSPGGQFSFESKSGTNQWHGTAYDYLRNGAFDANDWFNNYFGLKEPQLRQNDFGGTLSGPAKIPRFNHVEDKTFFFVSYEGLRLAAPHAAIVNYVPDATLRLASPAAVQSALNAFPKPNGPEVLVACAPATDPSCSPSGQKQDGLAEFIASWSNPASLDSTSVRFDHVVGNKLRLFFRFSNTVSQTTTRETYQVNGTPTARDVSGYTMRTYTGGATIAISNRLSNEFRVNYSSNGASLRTSLDSFGGGAPLDLATLSGVDPRSSQDQFVLAYDGYLVDLLSQQRQTSAQRQWNFVDTASLSSKAHHFKFGVDYRRLTPFEVPSSPQVIYEYFSSGAVVANAATVYTLSQIPAYPLYTNVSAFVQDEWRASQRLSLSMGLRWEVNPAPGVTQGVKPYTIQGASPNSWTLAQEGTPLWRTTWYNFAPRVGLAYILHVTPNWEMVARGGAGVFFDTGQQLGSVGINGGTGFSALASESGPFPEHVTVPVVTNPPAAPYIVDAFDSHLQLPYTIQWNASIEQALGKSQALTASYVGSHASRLLREAEILPANNPNVNFALFVQNGLTSDYDALQIQFRRRLEHGLTAMASYTWSHCIDYGSQNYFLGYRRGNCDFDIRQNLSAAFSYDVPDVGHNGFLHAALRHWGLDNRITVRTAFPVTLAGNFLVQPNGQFYLSGLNLVPGQPVYLYGANCASILRGLGDLAPGQKCPGGQAINPNAFTAVNSGFGNAPRNFALGFGAWQMNLAVRREFPIYENLKLQFRAEVFNVFNHPNFGNINPTLGTTSFGQATATLASSLSVLNPLYQTGGPRSMQFALKLLF
jgi:hypothetical protein